jgi:hypothetical protein
VLFPLDISTPRPRRTPEVRFSAAYSLLCSYYFASELEPISPYFWVEEDTVRAIVTKDEMYVFVFVVILSLNDNMDPFE